jgi:hypothetical protein
MSYEKLSSLPPGSSGNADEKQGPKGLPKNIFGNSTAPATLVIQKRPDYIIVNKANQGYKFVYDATGSIGTTLVDEQHTFDGSGWITSSIASGDAGSGPIRLDINPQAWCRTDGAGATGDITFVYQGAL